MTGLQIDYPSEWRYRLIGRSTDAIRAAVVEAVGERAYELAPSREGRSGRFVSMVLTITVESEDARLSIYTRLSEAEAIRIVL